MSRLMRTAMTAMAVLSLSVILSAQEVHPKFLTYPFNEPNVEILTGWYYSPNLPHRGIDYNLYYEDIVAADDGEVTKVKDDLPNLADDVDSYSGGFGNEIRIDHGGGWTTIYAHISPNALVDVGDHVTRGEVIGKSGHNGYSTAPHLHFDVWGPNTGGQLAKGAYKYDPYGIYSTDGDVAPYTNNQMNNTKRLWTNIPPIHASNYLTLSETASVGEMEGGIAEPYPNLGQKFIDAVIVIDPGATPFNNGGGAGIHYWGSLLVQDLNNGDNWYVAVYNEHTEKVEVLVNEWRFYWLNNYGYKIGAPIENKGINNYVFGDGMDVNANIVLALGDEIDVWSFGDPENSENRVTLVKKSNSTTIHQIPVGLFNFKDGTNGEEWFVWQDLNGNGGFILNPPNVDTDEFVSVFTVDDDDVERYYQPGTYFFARVVSGMIPNNQSGHHTVLIGNNQTMSLSPSAIQPPINFSLAVLSDTEIEVSATDPNNPAGLTTYEVDLNSSNPVIPVSGFPYTLSGLSPGTPYSIRLRSIYNGDYSEYSGTILATTTSSGGSTGPTETTFELVDPPDFIDMGAATDSAMFTIRQTGSNDVAYTISCPEGAISFSEANSSFTGTRYIHVTVDRSALSADIVSTLIIITATSGVTEGDTEYTLPILVNTSASAPIKFSDNFDRASVGSNFYTSGTGSVTIDGNQLSIAGPQEVDTYAQVLLDTVACEYGDVTVRFDLDFDSYPHSFAVSIYTNYDATNKRFNQVQLVINDQQQMVRMRYQDGDNYPVLQDYPVSITPGRYEVSQLGGILRFRNYSGGTPVDVSESTSVQGAGRVGFRAIDGTAKIDDLSVLIGDGSGYAALFSDDFNGNLSNFDITNSTATVDNGRLKLTHASGDFVRVLINSLNPIPTDCRVRFELDDGADGNGVATRVWLDYVDVNNNIWLQIINNPQQMVRCYQNYSGVGYELFIVTSGNLRVGDGDVLQVEKLGSTISLTTISGISNLNLSGILPYTPPAGQIGFEVISGTSYLDDLQVLGPDDGQEDTGGSPLSADFTDNFNRVNLGTDWEASGGGVVQLSNNSLQLTHPGGDYARAMISNNTLIPLTEVSVQFRLDDGTDANGVATRIWTHYTGVNDNIWLQIANTSQDMIRCYQNYQGVGYEIFIQNGVRLSEGDYLLSIEASTLRFQNLDGGTTIDLSGTLPYTPTAGQVGFEVINGTSYIDDVGITDLSAPPAQSKANLPALVELEVGRLPDTYALMENYPNPFNPKTVIRYSLPEDSQVKIVIFNLLGEKVRTLVDDMQSAGLKSVLWDAKDDNGRQVVSGVYFYRMITPEFTKTRKLLLLR